ncbi:UNVERIFIED_CONTAM: hypothetical protein RMT77_005601 [Armadillidium vulgare]
MILTSKQLSSFALRRVLEIFLANFATCLQASSFEGSEKRKLAQEEFGNKTFPQDERTFQASRNSLSATEDENSNKYYYIGGAVIAVVIILLIIVICCCCSRSKKKKKRKKESQKSANGKRASTPPTVNVFEPLDLEVSTISEESSLHQTKMAYSLSPVEVHHANDNDYSNQQNIPHTPPQYSKKPQGHAAKHDEASQRAYYGNERGYSAPFQISDEENLQGKQKKPLPKDKHEVYSKREVDEREYYGRKDNEISRNRESEANSRVPPSVYPVALNSSHRKTNDAIQDNRASLDRYDSVERRMNPPPPPPVAPKPGSSKKSFERGTEYMVKELHDDEYHRKNIDKPYPYSVHQKRVTDRMDRYPESRYHKDRVRPQSLFSEDPRQNSTYKTRQTGSFINKDYYSDKLYDRDSSFTSQKVSTSNNLGRDDFNSSHKENLTTKKDIPIPDPDYISENNVYNLTPPRERSEEKPPVPPKPSIKKREFKGPYGPDDLDDMFNPLTMAMRYKNRARVPFEVDDD